MRSRRDTKHGPAQYRATYTSQNQHKTHTNMLTSLKIFWKHCVPKQQHLEMRLRTACVCSALDHASKRLLRRVYFLTFGTYRCSVNCCQGFQRSEVCFFPVSRSIFSHFLLQETDRPTDVNGGPVSASQAEQTLSGSVPTADGPVE